MVLASGALSSGIGSGIDALGGDLSRATSTKINNVKANQIFGGAVGGGLGAVISRGSFWQGFGTGLSVGVFNHLVSDVFSQKKALPSFQKLEGAYPEYGPQYAEGGVSDDEFAKMVGGKVELNILNGTFSNTCALRVSYALTIAGEILPFVKGAGNSSSNSNGKWLYPRVKTLTAQLNKLYNNNSKNITNIADLKGLKGIIIFNTGGLYSDATGHATLWNGSAALGGNHNYLPMLGNGVTATLWITK
jgi:hypothetical protein